jgi:hypothetical protein
MKTIRVCSILFSGCLLACWMDYVSPARAASYAYDVKNQMTNAVMETGQKLIFTYCCAQDYLMESGEDYLMGICGIGRRGII